MKTKSIVYLEISILLMSIFSFAYIYKEASQNEEKNLLGVIWNLIKKPIIEKVSAINFFQCCTEDNSGAVCQDYLAGDIEENCAEENILYGGCDSFDQCRPGCCIDDEKGTCSKRSPQLKCEGRWIEDENCGVPECQRGCCILGSNSQFIGERECVSLSNSLNYPVNFDPAIKDELTCLFLTQKDDWGACLVDNYGGCKFTTRSDCQTITNNDFSFYKDYLCSNPELNTNCERQNYTSCVEDMDGVYWHDSCGNIENIYSSNKDASWNEGKILRADQICGMGENNIDNPDCGNCQHFLGSLCGQYDSSKNTKPTYGDYICQDLRCIDDQGNVRQNGESWCVYESAIGVDKDDLDNPLSLKISRDVPGSRHYVKSCLNGVVSIEACAEYRNQICVEERRESETGEFASADCRTNMWSNCLSLNSAENHLEKTRNMKSCEETPDCYVQKVYVDDGFKHDICVPKYPPGFDLVNNPEPAQAICQAASQSCTYIEEKKISGWDCIFNCDCKGAEFANKMHALCTSLGDCGYNVNVLGEEGDPGYEAVGSPDLIPNEIKSFNKPILGEYAYPSSGKIINSIGVNKKFDKEEAGEDWSGKDFVSGMQYASLGAGGVGLLTALHATTVSTATITGTTSMSVPLFSSSFQVPTFTTTALGGLDKAGYLLSQGMPTKSIDGVLVTSGGATQATRTTATAGANVAGGTSGGTAGGGVSTTATAGPVGPFSPAMINGLIAGAIVTGITMLSSHLLGFKGQAALIYSIYGAVFSTYVSISIAVGALEFKAFINGLFCMGDPITCGFVLVMILLIVLLKMSGLGETREKTVSFECYPWQPPLGGKDCERCGENGLPCDSAYKCQSLGQTCELINIGSGEERCISNSRNDVSAPTITPWEIDENVVYYEKSDRGTKVKLKNSDCIPAFTPLIIGIQTNEPAQCKIDRVHTTDYDEMESYFGSSNLYLENHSFQFSIPSPELLAEENNVPREMVLNEIGNMNFYVRCRDKNGNIKGSEYTIHMCISPEEDLFHPVIQSTIPEDKSFVQNRVENLSFGMFMSEPSNCKWSKNTQTYAEMENSFWCEKSSSSQSNFGWKCIGNLTGFNDLENLFYVSCEDISENKNLMPTREFTFYNSENDLEIVQIYPLDGTEIFSGEDYSRVELTAVTSGGAEDGNSECTYSINGGRDLLFTQSNYDTQHVQLLEYAPVGVFDLEVNCKDIAGNVANGTSSFEIIADNTGPIITRIFNDGELTLLTNEPSICKYALKPGTLWENKTEMTNSGTMHSVSGGDRYYIECEDNFNNKNQGGEISIKLYG